MGFFTNLAFQRYLDYRSTREARRKFAVVAGKYTTHSFPKGTEEIDLVNRSGDCEIFHEKENVLRLRYQERTPDHAWEAVIWMDTPHAGSIAWRYVRLFGTEPPAEHRFGFKRCQIVNKTGPDDSLQTYIYVSGDNDGYGKELWVKE